MIASLEDAWKWYQSVKALTWTLDRLGKKYWDELPPESKIGQDSRLRNLNAPQILDQTQTVSADLDDLGVLLLFSVFESLVRDHTLAAVKAELPTVNHPALREAIDDLTTSLEQGSFFKVLGVYKRVDSDLVEEVNQVRRYRNWVAHGRRNIQPDAVDPRTAYNRLSRFLEVLKITVEEEA